MSNPLPTVPDAALPRTAAGERLARNNIWPITMAGFGVMLFAGALLSSLLARGSPATSQPSDVPLPQTIVIGYVTSILTTATLLCGDALFAPVQPVATVGTQPACERGCSGDCGQRS